MCLISYIKASVRWFQRAVQLNNKSLERPLTKQETQHVRDYVLKPGLFGSKLEDMMKLQHSRFPKLRVPWLQVFLTEELLRGNGHQSEGVFRLSSDLDELTLVRLRLEKLFEPFRVVRVWEPLVLKANGEKYSSEETESRTRLDIFHPAPPNWSSCLSKYEAEPSISDCQISKKPILSCDALTGRLLLPLRPKPIDADPVQYMLLTPTSSWPCGLTVEPGMQEECVPDPHIAASLLKMWLRELEEPLIPSSLEQASLALGLSATDKAPEVQALVRKIPALNRRCLIYLFKLLQFLARPENADKTRMDARNLATVIGPNLFRSGPTSNHVSTGVAIAPSGDVNSPLGPGRDLLESIRLQTEFTKLLIERMDCEDETLFLNQEDGQGEVTQHRLNSPTPQLVRLAENNIYIPMTSATDCPNYAAAH
ncbi:Rho GTPase activating protein 39 [Cichlidogyrus casuarinus]|uniref:Rho GTPase activating protein 39 n=1 Tax=Cichlidogyrus casuarinus TaxID=1844966 RepID=A0ABD2QAT4_9PLAT